MKTFFIEVSYNYRGHRHTWRTDIREYSLTSAKERARRKFARDHMPEAVIVSVDTY
jgi:hypothetical protein